MNKRTLFLMIVVFTAFFAVTAHAQETGRIEGRVTGKVGGVAVDFANVYLKGTSFQALTDEKGRFLLENLPAGEYVLVVADDRYNEHVQLVGVPAGGTVQLEIILTTEAVVEDEIVVRGEREKESLSRTVISREEMKGIPGTGNDAIKVVQNLPGVAFTPAGASGGQGLVIRGTSPEDSNYYFNGFEIPILFHFGALISVVNAEFIDSIVYYPGSYSAKYGNATGGIIEVNSRELNGDKFSGVVDVGTYSSFVLLEGPVADKWSVGGAFRRSFIDLIMPYVIPEDEVRFTVLPKFYDYMFSLEYKPNVKNKLRMDFFGSRDAVSLVTDSVDEQDPFSGSSFDTELMFHRVDLHWNHFARASLFNEFSVSFLYQKVRFAVGYDRFLDINIYAPEFRNDLVIKLGDSNELKIGAEGHVIAFDLSADVTRQPKEGEPEGGNLSNNDLFLLDESLTTFSGVFYAEDAITLTKWWDLIPGARFAYLAYNNDTYLDPRLATRFYPTEASTIKAGVGLYHQWPETDELIDGSGNPDLISEVAYNYTVGFEYQFPKDYSIDVQGFYKDLQNLVSPNDDEIYKNTGKGYVYGAELLARKRLTDRFFGWVSYTYSESRRKDAPNADWRYFDEDQTHNFIVLASYYLGANKQWRIGGRWQYSTGLPFTQIDTSIYNADTDSYIPLFSDKVNGRRNPDFHQLDLRVDKIWYFKTWQLDAYLDVQNVYWMEYPFGYVYNYDYSDRQYVSFPLFYPSIGVQARF